MNKDLSENSISYYEGASVYQTFSDAEDYPGYVFDFLKQILNNKQVLDVGCGNAKYCNLLSQSCSIIGVDKAQGQLQQAKKNYPHLNLVQADCLSLPFYNTFDYAICCWMLGTLIYPEKQILALSQIKQALKTDGKVILIENDVNSEFEAIRCRDTDNRTKDYNDFLLQNGFRVIKKINSYFQFENSQIANECFSSIWGDNLAFKIQSNRVQHDILILSNF